MVKVYNEMVDYTFFYLTIAIELHNIGQRRVIHKIIFSFRISENK